MTADVRKYIGDAITAHPDASAQEIAVYAADAVPVKELRVCLAAALVDMSRHLIGNGRRNAMDGALNSNSPKMRDRASWWAKMLGERVNVGGVWKVLADCTFDDLQACIDDREMLISRISGQIDNYKRLQKLLIEHRAKTVAEVPDQTEWADQ